MGFSCLLHLKLDSFSQRQIVFIDRKLLGQLLHHLELLLLGRSLSHSLALLDRLLSVAVFLLNSFLGRSSLSTLATPASSTSLVCHSVSLFLFFVLFQSFQEGVKVLIPNLEYVHLQQAVVLGSLVLQQLLEFFHFLLSKVEDRHAQQVVVLLLRDVAYLQVLVLNGFLLFCLFFLGFNGDALLLRENLIDFGLGLEAHLLELGQDDLSLDAIDDDLLIDDGKDEPHFVLNDFEFLPELG